MHFTRIVISAFLLAFIISCDKKNDIHEGTRLKSSTTTSITLPLSGKDSFIYDADQRLSAIKHIPDNSVYDIHIKYGSNDRLTEIVYTYQGTERLKCLFIYNASGQIIRKTFLPVQGIVSGYDQSYSYDNSGRLVSDTTYDEQSTDILYYNKYTYDNLGNITEFDFIDLVNPSNQGMTYYKFDNKPNPFHKVGPLYYIINSDIKYINPNNIVESNRWWAGAASTQYEYQSNGLPRKSVTIDPIGPSGQSTYTVTMEYW